MATTTKIHLTANEKPAFFVAPLRKDSAEKASELLQENHEKHHIYFNNDGFHVSASILSTSHISRALQNSNPQSQPANILPPQNHIVHHLLTLYALGATPSQLQTGYDANKTYQRPPVPLDPQIVQDLNDRAAFAKHLGDERHYRDYLAHFEGELAAKGVSAVLAEYLFARDARADDLLARTFAGFVHPLIHLGFGVEFGQPAIVAEALAQAATHDAWIGGFLLGAEKAAAERKASGAAKQDGGDATLMQLVDEIRSSEKTAKAARWEDRNRLRDGVIKRAGPEMRDLAARWVVDGEEDLERKTAEMIDASGKRKTACSS